MTVATAVFWKRVTAGAIVLEGALGRGARSPRKRRAPFYPWESRCGPGRAVGAEAWLVGASSGASPRSGYAHAMRHPSRPTPVPARRPASAAGARGGGRRGLRSGRERTARLVAPRRPRRGIRSRRVGRGVEPVGHPGDHRPAGEGAVPLRLLVPGPGHEPARRRARTGRRQVAFIAARVQRARGRRAGHLRLGDRGLARRVRRQTEFPAAGDWKAVFITQAPDSPQEAIGVAFQVQEELPVVDIGEKAPASDDPDGGRRRRRPQADHHGSQPRPELLRAVRVGRAGAGQAVRAHLRDPGVLPERPVRPDPRAGQEGRRDGPRRHRVHQRGAVPDRRSPRGACSPCWTRTASSSPSPSVDEWGILSEPWIFAVDGDGIVRGSFEGVATDEELNAAFEAISGT